MSLALNAVLSSLLMREGILVIYGMHHQMPLQLIGLSPAVDCDEVLAQGNAHTFYNTVVFYMDGT